MTTETHRINRFAEIEGSDATGWTVINLLTGTEDRAYPTLDEAKKAANFLYLYYAAIERGS